MHIAIIGGGAAGCFAAIELKRRLPEAKVTIYESGNKLLAKVAVTGGGRCNLTNSFLNIKSLEAVYPRGARLMKRLLYGFNHKHICAWFKKEGVRLVTQEDQCVFPASQDAMEIVNTLSKAMHREGVTVKTGRRVSCIERMEERFRISFANDVCPPQEHDAVLVTTGGSPKLSGLDFLNDLGLKVITPIPSLFSLCLPGNPITELTGTVVENVGTSLVGTKLCAEGPLLITHWGMSGPAILKLSSYAARQLSESDYKVLLSVNWWGNSNEEEVAEKLTEIARQNQQKKLATVHPPIFNARLWTHLLQRADLKPEQRWAELGGKSFNKLIATLTNDIYTVDGKNRFKDEFVTCGGIALNNINPNTLECKNIPNLYFAGEVLDVDAITGGFNLQAAWTMGYVAAKNLAEKFGEE